MDKLIDLILNPPSQKEWNNKNDQALTELFGGDGGRYPKEAQKSVQLRAPEMSGDDQVAFAAYIHPNNPTKGMYGGMCFVIFPIYGGPCLVAMGIGTQGLNPDEYILSRPGHARKVKAICEWLNANYGNGSRVAWAKQDPTRTDIDIPDPVKGLWPQYEAVFKRYGKVLYGIYVPVKDNRKATEEAVKAFLDFSFAERGYLPLSNASKDGEDITQAYMQHVFPVVTPSAIRDLLSQRRYVILEGPPGTGKTYLAGVLLSDVYHGNGKTIQFHPNTTYENLVGGLAPQQTNIGYGFTFAPKQGYLMEAVAEARKNPEKPYLLNIDEINRADLAKILGESIYLFEIRDAQSRRVALPYDFGEPIGRELSLPENLHILGTMNSSDRSIAIIDVAIRRRFAFLKLWPDKNIVDQNGCDLMKKAFTDLLDIFIKYASDEALNLMPGHAYFLEKDEKLARTDLKTRLYPLLEEYVAQGYVTGFAEDILAYMQWLKSLA